VEWRKDLAERRIEGDRLRELSRKPDTCRDNSFYEGE
jgi:hypothetical protein